MSQVSKTQNKHMLVASHYYHMYSFATNELPQISFDKTCNSANHKELAQACLNYSLPQTHVADPQNTAHKMLNSITAPSSMETNATNSKTCYISHPWHITHWTSTLQSCLRASSSISQTIYVQTYLTLCVHNYRVHAAKDPPHKVVLCKFSWEDRRQRRSLLNWFRKL